MTMHVEVEFSRPLAATERRCAVLALAALAKSERVRFVRGDRALVVSGEALGAASVKAALLADALPVESARSSLGEDADRTADDQASGGGERLRPLGR